MTEQEMKSKGIVYFHQEYFVSKYIGINRNDTREFTDRNPNYTSRFTISEEGTLPEGDEVLI